MKRAIAVSAAVAILGSTLVPAANAGGRYPKDCGPYGLTGHVKSKNVDCHLARKVVSKYFVKAQAQGEQVTVKHFACDGDVVSEGFDVFCTRHHGRELVHYRGATS